jgi:hypothetical protein
MASNEKSARGLTRALLLGIAVGPILQVGCAPYQAPQAITDAAAGTGWSEDQTLAARLASPDELCARAIASRSASDVDVLLSAFPDTDCIPPTLAAMPPATLQAVSPALLATIPPEIWRQVPPQTVQYLRRPSTPFAQAPRSPASARGEGGSGPY